MKKTTNLPNAIPADGTNPHGRVKNESGLNVGDGTPVNDASSGDVRVSMEELIVRVGDTVNDELEDSVNGFQIVDAIYKVPPPDDSVSTLKIQNGAVTPDKIADDAVTNDKISTNAVTNDSIATDAVNSDSIASGAVGTSELSNDSVTSDKIAANAVGSSEIAANAVGSSEIAANAVGTSEIGFSAFQVIASGDEVLGNFGGTATGTINVTGISSSDMILHSNFITSGSLNSNDIVYNMTFKINSGNFNWAVTEKSGDNQNSTLRFRWIVVRII